MNPVRSPWIVAFAATTVAHLALLAADVTPWDSITKCLLAPLLIGWVLQLRAPKLLVVALIGCFFGDLFLEFDEAWFPVGMAAFAVAHVCFIVFFVQRGAGERLKKMPWLPVVFLILGAALIAWCWSGLPSDIKPLVPIYAALLSGTAMAALAVDKRAGLGAVAFLISDGIIAAGEAGRVDPEHAVVEVAIMALYISAIFLLTTGIMNRERQATDCWPRLP